MQFAGIDQTAHVEKCLAYGAPDREQAMIPHEQAMLVAEVRKYARHFVGFLCEAFELCVPSSP